jgi:hypothetical protein
MMPFFILFYFSIASHTIYKACGILDIHVLTINPKEKSTSFGKERRYKIVVHFEIESLY